MIDAILRYLAPAQYEDLIPVAFGFQVSLPTVLCAFILLGVAIGVGTFYWKRLDKCTAPVRVTLTTLRVVVIVLALGLLMDPAIIAQHVKPGEQIVALLFDDSLSMRIGGGTGESRGDRLVSQYTQAKAEFEDELSGKHQIVKYRVGAGLEPLSDIDALTFDEPESNLIDGIGQVLSDLEGTTVSAVILFSDGVQQADETLNTAESVSPTVPVYTVGVDTTTDWSDIQLSSLSVKRTEFDKSPVVVTAGVHSLGMKGFDASVVIRLGDRVVKRMPIVINQDEQEHKVRAEFVPDRKEWIGYTAEVVVEEDGQERDRIAENNSRTFVVDNRDKEYKILYIAGRPNWEYKFISRALKEEKQFDFASLIFISTAEPTFEFKGKDSTLSNPLFEGIDADEDQARYDEAVFLRFGMDADELVGGIPDTPDELFGYDLVILGDIERELFSTRQLEVIRDFVDVRGGSLLVQGGANGFTEGGYAGTPIENLLPVVLYAKTDGNQTTRGDVEFQVEPTIDGTLAGVWSLDLDENANALAWEEMPPLYGMSYFPVTRAGATVMAEGRESESSESHPLFAMQRYGEGLTGILATGETWQWQMRMGSEDDRHERIWRQIVRYLSYQTLDRSRLRDKRDAYTQFTPHPLEFVVRNEEFVKQEGLQATLLVTTPSGKAKSVPVDESLEELGVYYGRYVPEEPGLHALTLLATDDQERVIGRLEETMLVEADRNEFQMAQYSPRLLESLSQASGGKRFTLDQLGDLARAIPLPLHQDTDDVVLHLWHLPIFYWIFILCLPLEWYLRRRRGLA